MDIDFTTFEDKAKNLSSIKDEILWDYDIANDGKFGSTTKGFAFVIDVYDKKPRLALEKISAFVSSTVLLEDQPPQEMLVKAIKEQGGDLNKSALYNTNEEIKEWVKQNLL